MQSKSTAKDFFFFLSGFVTLYVSAISLISLLFSIINKAFPDSLSYSYYYGAEDIYSGGMRLAIASLIIIFPLYLVIASYLNRYLRSNPDKRDFAPRKWLTYLTIFVTGIAVAVDLVTLVNTFLGGEITIRFILKVLAVLVVAGAVFWYYLYDLRKSFLSDMPNRSRLLVSIASVFVLAALVTGFALAGSPMKARALRFDARRTGDLQSIQSQILYGYWQQKGELPEKIDDLDNPLWNNFNLPKDPETGKDYVYKKTGALSFELCATYELASPRTTATTIMNPDMDNWQHEAGNACFARTVDPKLFPVVEIPVPAVR